MDGKIWRYSLVPGYGFAEIYDPDENQMYTVCAAHAEWRPVQPLVIGAEYRQIGTRYPAGTYGARHVNLIFGVEL